MDVCKKRVIMAHSLADGVDCSRSNYVTQDQARSRGLATVSGSSFILRADATTKLSSDGSGRDSFRIISNNKYGTHVSV